MKTFFDSPHGDKFVDPIRVSVSAKKTYPIREDLTAINYQIEYAHREEFFKPSPLGLICPDDKFAVLVNESNPVNDGYGIVKFVRMFSTIPADRNEFESGSFTFPSFKNFSSDTTTNRSNFSVNGVIKVSFSYLHTKDPENELLIQEQFSPRDVHGNKCNFIASDTNPPFPDYINMMYQKAYLNTKQTEVTRWMGNIWQMKNTLIKAQ